MIVLFATMTIDPEQGDEIDAEMARFLADSAEVRSAAIHYEFLANPADPSLRYIFQAWPDEASFQAWVASDAHEAFAAHIEATGRYLSSDAKMFHGVTGFTGI